MNTELKPCPFCGDIPDFPEGIGTQYEMYCECGMSMSCVQISDLMTIEERLADPFTEYSYRPEYIERAKLHAAEQWNRRAESSPHVVAEPVAWLYEHPRIGKNVQMEYMEPFGDWTATPLYAAPQQTAPVTEAKALSKPDAWFPRWHGSSMPFDPTSGETEMQPKAALREMHGAAIALVCNKGWADRIASAINFQEKCVADGRATEAEKDSWKGFHKEQA